MSTAHLACAARADYLPHAAAMLHSVLVNGGLGDPHIHFLHGPELPRSDAEALEQMVVGLGGTVSFLAVAEDRIEGLRTRGDFLPASHWYRIFLPELLPDVDRVLYLDGDLIAVDSLEPLWRSELGDQYLAAVTNVFLEHDAGRPAALGLRDARDYFNSGVLLMNLELMRRDAMTDALRSYGLANAEKLAWPEQDALNVVLGERRLHLHPRWNLMNSILLFPSAADVFGTKVVTEARRNPAIRHFEGPGANKPWHHLCEREGRELYVEHRRQTPWPLDRASA